MKPMGFSIIDSVGTDANGELPGVKSNSGLQGQ